MSIKIRKRGICKRCHRKISFTEEREYCTTCQRLIDAEEQKNKLIPPLIIKEEPKKPEETLLEKKVLLEKKEESPPLPLLLPKPKEKEPEPSIIVEKIKLQKEKEIEQPTKPIELPKEELKIKKPEPKTIEKIKPQETENNVVMKEVDFGKCDNWHICRAELKTTMNKLRGKRYCDECFKKELEETERYIVRLATLKDIKRMIECCELWMIRDQNKRKKLLVKMLSRESFFIVIALLEKEVVGFMGWHIIREWTSTYNRLISTGIFIIVEHRHKGLLDKMWKTTLETCKGLDLKLCLIDTDMNYPKYLGFKESKIKLWTFNWD